MNQNILTFLTDNRVGALTILRKDGSPHSAALHYSHSPEPLELYFSTENTSRKAEALLDGQNIHASFVVGLSEEEWITLQINGAAKIIQDKNELTRVHAIHYAKHPDSEQWKDDPATIFIKFTPTWWRYTNYNTDPPTFISSEKS